VRNVDPYISRMTPYLSRVTPTRVSRLTRERSLVRNEDFFFFIVRDAIPYFSRGTPYLSRVSSRRVSPECDS